MRIGEQFFHGRIAHLRGYIFGHERLKIRVWRQLSSIRQRGRFTFRAVLGRRALHRFCQWQGFCWRSHHRAHVIARGIAIQATRLGIAFALRPTA